MATVQDQKGDHDQANNEAKENEKISGDLEPEKDPSL